MILGLIRTGFVTGRYHLGSINGDHAPPEAHAAEVGWRESWTEKDRCPLLKSFEVPQGSRLIGWVGGDATGKIEMAYFDPPGLAGGRRHDRQGRGRAVRESADDRP